VEVCQPIESAVQETLRVKMQTLPLVQTMACTLHDGPFATVHEAYDAIVKWIDANGYRIVGPAREVNLQVSAASLGSGAVKANQTDPATIVEVQFPVEKAK
jgi:effector-binding domain-containing protein